jgi:hypothetical protein
MSTPPSATPLTFFSVPPTTRYQDTRPRNPRLAPMIKSSYRSTNDHGVIFVKDHSYREPIEADSEADAQEANPGFIIVNAPVFRTQII